MTELPNPPTEAPQPNQSGPTIKPSQKSEVHPDRRILVGFASGTVAVVAVAHQLSLRSVTTGLAATATCTALYLGWLYSRDRYMRWVITRHTYRPTER